jgi:hypothetical protein
MGSLRTLVPPGPLPATAQPPARRCGAPRRRLPLPIGTAHPADESEPPPQRIQPAIESTGDVMSLAPPPDRQRWLRPAVLGVALTLGVAVALCGAPDPVGVALAADTPATTAAAPPAAPATAPAPSESPSTTQGSRKAASPPKTGAAFTDEATDDTTSADDAATEVTIDHRGIGVLKDGKRVRISGLGADREYDSFRDFVNDAPWLAALVFLLVLLFFLTPLLILVLVIWYKVRKTRMQNETMLKLAERGIVPPAEAMQTLAGTGPPSGVPPSVAPLYEQVRQIRRRTAWSDLRRGVVLVAVGLGFIFYSMIGDGEPNWIGLICFFLGIGYCVLWFFEDRHTGTSSGGAGTPPAGSA